jgi:hypothetical protein
VPPGVQRSLAGATVSGLNRGVVHWLQRFSAAGDRRAAYEAIIAALPTADRYSSRDFLLGALAVAGIGPEAADVLARYWPGTDHRPLFSDPREYMPRLLSLAARSSWGRFRGEVVHRMSPVSRAEFATWGFDDTTMPLPQRLMIAVKLQEPELFGALLDESAFRAEESRKSFLVYSPPLTLDYHVGPNGPFIYYPDINKSSGTQRLTAENLFQLLAVPDTADSQIHSRYFRTVIPKSGTDDLDIDWVSEVD